MTLVRGKKNVFLSVYSPSSVSYHKEPKGGLAPHLKLEERRNREKTGA